MTRPPENKDAEDVGCARVAPSQPGETAGQRGRRYIAFAWPFFAIPAVLTAMILSFEWFNWKLIPIAYALNLLVTVCIGGSIILVHTLVAKRLARMRPTWLAHVSAAVATVAGVVLGAELAVRSTALLAPWIEMNAPRRGLIGVGLVIAGIIHVIELAYERLRRRARQVELREEQAQRQALRAQFEALQARTNPHFLYNSLNTVAGLIEEDPQRAEQALEKLSDLFRYSLEGSRREQVSLGDEARTVRGYLEMEALRFGERLRYEVVVPRALTDLAVPPLLLQPLVENAVLHGIGPRTEGGTLRVAAAQSGDVLHLTVEDDGPGPGQSQHRGSRTSLDDLARRLELLYGGVATLESGRGDDGGFRVHIQLPARPFLATTRSDDADSSMGTPDVQEPPRPA